MRPQVLASITSVTATAKFVFVREEAISTASSFDRATGNKIVGSLDLSPEEVLYLVWRQKQSPRLKEQQLMATWREQVYRPGEVK